MALLLARTVPGGGGGGGGGGGWGRGERMVDGLRGWAKNKVDEKKYKEA